MSMDMEHGQQIQRKVCFLDTQKNMQGISSYGEVHANSKNHQMCMPDTHQKNTLNAETFVTAGSCQLVILSKNVRGLTSENQFSLILAELGKVHWDILVLSETWRHEAQEVFVIVGNHTYFGSGGVPGKRGVGILVHARHRTTLRDFKSINERMTLCSLTLRVRAKVRLIALYFPYCGAQTTMWK